ncbi:unnamed protein product [Moneuplotes crassus]|uniref:Uncharacterized protein n=1 Tax=Euplotes crassus TaxID=5936 RepID=A0AAD1XTE3_EUPCR|nr:unnamed protein product [Moneuplotes crassus]
MKMKMQYLCTVVFLLKPTICSPAWSQVVKVISIFSIWHCPCRSSPRCNRITGQRVL